MLLDALKPSVDSNKYLLWMRTGGEFTLLGYLKRAGENCDNPYSIMRARLSSFIPKNHIEFLENLDWYYENGNDIFVHAGCDPMQSLLKQDKQVLIWDRSFI
ncbi:MAG: hypothetical protein HC877_24115 [Thioploca sp.]|nr:hypothetical protein [Thioploca sp.]